MLLWSAAVGFVASSFVGPLEWVPMPPAAWGWMVAISLLGAMAHFALTKAMEFAEAAAVQPYSYTLLVWATVLGAVFYGDIPDGWTFAGAALIVGSGLYTWHRDRVEARANIA